MKMKTTLNTTQFNHNLKPARLAALAALALITFASAVTPVAAQEVKPRPAITVAQLAGKWQVAMELNGGCGVGSKLVIFTLTTSGTGPASFEANTLECGPGSGTGTMTITSLKSDGSGTAVLSLNFVGNFDIQVSPNGQVMNMVEVADTGNYDVGTAVKQ
jgi:hypothetical protein